MGLRDMEEIDEKAMTDTWKSSERKLQEHSEKKQQ